MRNWGILAVAGMMSALLADLFLAPILFKYLRVFGNDKRTSSEAVNELPKERQMNFLDNNKTS